MKWRTSLHRRSRAAENQRGLMRRLRGHGGPITFLAVVGILGVASGFALADPGGNGNPPLACGTDGHTATRIDSPSDNETTSVQVIGGATLTFVFNADHTSAVWTADAPFTGTILVKAASENANGSGGETTFTFNNATQGTVFSPFTNDQGQTHAISHVDTCGTGSTTTGSTTTHTSDTTLTSTTTSTVNTTGPNTTTTTTPVTTTTVPLTTTVPFTSTTTVPGSTVTETTTNTSCDEVVAAAPRSLTTVTITQTTTHSVPGSTVTVTRPETTETVTDTGSTVTETGTDEVVSTVTGEPSTVTDCTTVPTTSTLTSSTAGTTTGGTLATTTAGSTTSTTSNVAGTTKKGGGNGNGPAAGTVQNASGGLPFTGLHVPLLILLGVGMAATGLVLRKRLGSFE
jgi:hypothetical protein